MTQPGTKVGDGYIDVEPRIDRTQLNRHIRELSRQRGLAVTLDGKFSRPQLQRSLREITPRPTITLDAKFSRPQIVAALRGMKNPTINVDVDTNAFRRGIANAFDGVDRDVRHRGRRSGGTFGRHFRGAFEGVMSLLPARLENVFTRTGPLIGGALAVAIGTGLAVALPVVITGLMGGLVASIGLGAMAGGIALIADDPRVKKAGQKVLDTLVGGKATGGKAVAAAQKKVDAARKRASDIQMFGAKNKKGELSPGAIRSRAKARHDEALALRELAVAQKNVKPERKSPIKEAARKAFVGPTVTALDTINKSILKNMPHITKMLTAAAKFVPIVTKGVTMFMDNLLPGLSQLMASPFMTDIMKVFASGLGKIGSAISDFFTRILSDPRAMKGILLGFEDLINFVASAIRLTGDFIAAMGRFWNWFNEKLPGLRQRWKDFNNQLKLIWEETANFFRGTWTNMAGGLRNAWTASAGFFRNTWTAVASWLRNTWTNEIAETFRNAWTNVANFFRTKWTEFAEFTRNTWTNIANFVRNTWNNLWGNVKAAIATAFGIIKNIFATALGIIRAMWNGFWSAVLARAGSFLSAIGRAIWGALSFIRRIWNNGWQGVLLFAIRVWNSIFRAVSSRFEDVRKTIFGILGAIKKRWGDIWGGIYTVLASIWKKISGAVEGGINTIITVLNKGIDRINGVLAKLGVKFRIPRIGNIGEVARSAAARSRESGPINRARGGPIRGPGTGTSDSIRVNLSDGEYVVNAKATKKYKPWLDQINFGMATGGQFTYPGIIALAKKSGFHSNPGSTYRPGDRVASGGLSYHSKGWAVDFMGYSQDALANFFYNMRTLEVIHHSIKTGRVFAKYNGKPGSLVPGHEDHLHVAMSPDQIANPGSVAGAPGFEFLSKGWNWVYSHLLRPVIAKFWGAIPGGDAPKELMKGGAKALGGQIITKTKEEFQKMVDEFMSFMSINASGNPDVPGKGAARWSSTVLQALGMLGLPKSWLGPTLTLISRESGGNQFAINRWDSNAQRGDPSRGLMQTIGSTFNRYKFPGFNNIFGGLDNILAGLRYIRARYGSIFNVQQAVGRTPRGYDGGGYVPPGDTLIRNRTGRPELMLNHNQEEAIMSGGRDVYVTVKVGDEIIIDKVKAVVDENNNAIISGFRSGVR